jgi:hypothetical protein
MDETGTRQLIADHFAAAGKDEAEAAEIFAADAVVEWPQSGERIRGKPHIIALHEASPASIRIHIRRALGCGDLWVTEATITYDGVRSSKAVFIMEFRDGKVVRETDYFGDAFEAPAYRSAWVESMTEEMAGHSSAGDDDRRAPR